MPAAVQKMSLEEFLAQPGETFHDFHELHDGEIVEAPPPTNEHVDVQKRLEALLHERCGRTSYGAYREFYMTLPTESRRVDVSLVREARRAAQRGKVFFGSPELVIEVLSPSNTVLDIDRLRSACFKDECIEFWVVNMELRIVTVYTRNVEVHLYVEGNQIPLTSFADVPPIPVKQIFE
jgi:Uma2 family endonuclease